MIIVTMFGALEVTAAPAPEDYAMPNNDVWVSVHDVKTLEQLERYGAAFGLHECFSDSPTMYRALCTRASLGRALAYAVGQVDYVDAEREAGEREASLFRKVRGALLDLYRKVDAIKLKGR